MLESFSRASRRAGALSAILCLTLAGVAGLAAASKVPIKNLRLDPTAEQVDLFDAMDKGLVKVKLVPKSSLKGSVFFENTTQKPLTIKFPAGMAATQILPQGGAGIGGGPAGGGGGGFGGGGLGGGGGQAMGGGLGGGGLGGGGGFGGGGGGLGGGGVFSVPAERIAQVPWTSVCLEHGKTEPRSTMTYKLVKLEDQVKDPVVRQLVVGLAKNEIGQDAAQCAVWHKANGLTWEQLASKTVKLPGQPAYALFSQDTMFNAVRSVNYAEAVVREQAKAAGESEQRDTAPKKLEK